MLLQKQPKNRNQSFNGVSIEYTLPTVFHAIDEKQIQSALFIRASPFYSYQKAPPSYRILTFCVILKEKKIKFEEGVPICWRYVLHLVVCHFAFCQKKTPFMPAMLKLKIH